MMLHGAQQETPRQTRKQRLSFALQMARQAEKIGGRINELRTAQGWSKAEMSRRLPGVSSGNDIRRWENGAHLPRSDTLEAIATLFETTIEDLYAGPMAEREAKGPTPDVLAALNGDSDLAAIRERLDSIDAALDEQASKLGELAGVVSEIRTDQQRQHKPPEQAEDDEAGSAG